MTRRLVIAGALIGVVAGAGAAFADTTTPPKSLTHEICIATSNDPHHQTTDDLCVTWPGAQQ
jgi:hypothetical protein